MKKWMLSAAIVAAGNLLYALTVKLFVLPTGLVMGGTTGLGLTANYLIGVPISAFVLAFNMVMLLLGLCVLGRRFAATTLLSSFIYPLALEFWQRLLGDYMLTEDVMLCTLFAGLGVGASLGLVIRAGASTGGMDIPPLILNRLFRAPVSVCMYFFDVCILLSQGLFQSPEKLLYGVVLVMIYTMVLDKMLLMGTSRIEIKVVSEKSEEIRQAILQDLNRGVTLIQTESGYLRQNTQLVLSVLSSRELPKAEKLIHQIDPECFLMVSRISEVKGRGFSMQKKYR
ncbi:YitT family protein [Intestinimonas butyriciproducens]|uniref:YitT family protein n=1 Tax=Intestinimonas butyriciproducens TaxID=1297617 RepID=UPI001FAF6B34|nr:YitT family protein [Intestinimonas butyriciproducens]